MERFKFACSVTPSDSTNNILDKQAVPQACQSRILNCSVAGTISFVDGQGNITSFTAVAGINYPISTMRVRATGTTATGITALW